MSSYSFYVAQLVQALQSVLLGCRPMVLKSPILSQYCDSHLDRSHMQAVSLALLQDNAPPGPRDDAAHEPFQTHAQHGVKYIRLPSKVIGEGLHGLGKQLRSRSKEVFPYMLY